MSLREKLQRQDLAHYEKLGAAVRRIAELEAALGKAIDYCDAATHGDGQYADERQALIQVWRGDE